MPSNVEASVTFKPTESGQGHTAGAQIVGGKYDSPKSPMGPVKVFISIQQPTGKMTREGSGNPYPEYKSLTSAEYGSGINLNVAGDNQSQDFDLKAP
ncbi:MAG TPA: hypothetical protein VGM76_01765 [Lacipirellulaceae bacterium]